MEYRAMFFLVQRPPLLDRPCVYLIFEDPGFFYQRLKDVLLHGLIWGKSARGRLAGESTANIQSLARS